MTTTTTNKHHTCHDVGASFTAASRAAGMTSRRILLRLLACLPVAAVWRPGRSPAYRRFTAAGTFAYAPPASTNTVMVEVAGCGGGAGGYSKGA
jgi:hypothetical protein